ncbi:DNA sulfur modification protein DndB [Alteromonas sp. CYL-A6]|uniref:DNA sulfur modification protein DndB n=1 Tax=Alteromonas nitratireducens TaxID=3390813 RepID=UPI0034BF1003
MSNKTLIPALKAKVGDWNYYICVMKYAQVAKECSFAYELGGNPELNELLQRGISDRTQGIVEYLIKSEHRFLGSLIVAAWGGHPNYIPVKMDESDDLIKGLDSGFGVLTFDGSQQYFALDGQHRLRAIKDAIKRKPELGNEEISVILVSHFNTPEGQERTRRLFSNINKNAKSTTSTENIVLDEDDGYAVINRRLINEHPILSDNGVVSIYRRQNSEGGLSISTSVSNSDRKAITSIKQLYEMVKALSVGTEIDGHNINIRPTDDDLEQSYNKISDRITNLFEACGDVLSLSQKDDIRVFRKNKMDSGKEHAFLKGVIQRVVTDVISQLIREGRITWEQAFVKLSELDWNVKSSPWNCVCNISETPSEPSKMLTSRDFTALLEDMLKVHIAPKTRADIKKARKAFLDLRGFHYPVSEDVLSVNLEQQASSIGS